MFSDPQKNIEQFMLGEDWHVADFGASSGAYSIAASRAVGPDGKVYAIDVQQEPLARLNKEANEQRLGNIDILRGNLEKEGGSHLGDSSMDAVIVSNILFQLEDKKSFIEEVKRVLKQGGKVLVVEWSGSFSGMGPSSESVVKESEAKELFSTAGFVFEKDISAGSHHYGFVLKK